MVGHFSLNVILRGKIRPILCLKIGKLPPLGEAGMTLMSTEAEVAAAVVAALPAAAPWSFSKSSERASPEKPT